LQESPENAFLQGIFAYIQHTNHVETQSFEIAEKRIILKTAGLGIFLSF